ncbi:MAG: cytochrome c [Pseudobdellovibrionaceae bacterium]
MISAKIYLALFLFGFSAWAAEPDWSEGHSIPQTGRSNPYELSPTDWAAFNQAGRLHAQIYPVEITGALPPYRPIKNLIENKNNGVFRKWLSKIIRGISNMKSFEDVELFLGLNPYPTESDTGVYSVPYPNGQKPEHRMGTGFITRDGGTGVTFSCASCHSSNLFGKTVLGMTNRFPRTNEFFIKAQSVVSVVPPSLFKAFSKATKEETELYRQSRKNIRYIGAVRPLVRGLDTSLAQVALSLRLRGEDEWAEKDTKYLYNPRYDELLDQPADSKPAVWWNVKYKTRWLSDGSVVSGNPIYTNILWNEIGRGTDLRDLNEWFQKKSQVIEELATAVFSSQAPLYIDFFPAESIDLERAKQGQKIFVQNCAKCHGQYQKNWDVLPESAPLSERLKTYQVLYHQRTPVIDVGTDSFRRRGMKSLEKLNDLKISKDFGVVIKEQKGYVPPPLVGIWARWPYFHNNSAPSLCAVLTASSKRPKVYWAVAANNPAEDFDSDCNGYPMNLPEQRKKSDYKYNTQIPGLGNSGHDEGIFLSQGQELLSLEEKRDLILFLKTL